MVFILAASSGCRIGEILGLEVKDLFDDLTTIHVVQQAKGTKLTLNLKTINSQRFVDTCPEVAALLKEFLGERISGLGF
jgi:integrase